MDLIGLAKDVRLGLVVGPCAKDPGPSVTANADFMAAGALVQQPRKAVRVSPRLKSSMVGSQKRNEKRQGAGHKLDASCVRN